MKVLVDTPVWSLAFRKKGIDNTNECRRNGIQGSHTDFLICAVAIKNGWDIFTEDADFIEYKKYIPIGLYAIK